MEEKRKQGQPEKLSYEELAKNFGELHLNYQKLVQEYQKAMAALQSRDFEYTSFFLSTLFKVMEHPEMYKSEFVEWAMNHIQDALYAFEESMVPAKTEERTNEAE